MNVNAARAIVVPEQFGIVLSAMLLKWAEEQEKEFFKAIDEAGEACNREAKNALSKGHGIRTGTYRSKFRLASEQPTKHHKYVEWYVDAPHYRLTHLLEYGHAIKDGTGRTVGRANPVKHIKYGRQIAEQVLEERLQGLWTE